uniref:3-deoxy-D-manno-oct-2-ulosonic acid (Kdo) hydroxylase n=1 Tax=Siphoviridae sp. ctet217 TaxID=2826409 RepID=A0A8S5MET9_9CAUD|nr:MAG TPA: 3-deoxy-D-manno-oct-2-ulosonic acid (Kdo) hydroxylase [Siphoviridae sp. ctet217]DAN31232.1 MAG TPA: 3-deoxy-D-manno-oct-2-ulosonic acid (Kdo) hydroxylase [Caudoviricetes sp.]
MPYFTILSICGKINIRKSPILRVFCNITL